MSCQFPLKAMTKLLPDLFRSGARQYPYVVHYLIEAGKLFVEKMFLIVRDTSSPQTATPTDCAEWRIYCTTPQSDQLQKVAKLLLEE